MVSTPKCPACGRAWVSADGGKFDVCRRCPYRLLPESADNQPSFSTYSGAGGGCMAAALVKNVLDLTAEVHALKAERADEARQWAELFLPEKEGDR